MPESIIPKQIRVKFDGATTNDPVTVKNNTTKEIMTRDKKDGSLLRLDSKEQSVLINADNFVNGWVIGDVLTISIGGLTAGTTNVTLTVAKSSPQTSTVTAIAVSTAVIDL